MIIPSIDLQGGQAVQLVMGDKKELDAGDPRPLAEKFRIAGEIAVIDLDAAMGTGDNSQTIKELCKIAPCRVGGGIRSVERAIEWLDAGAVKVILGTAATPEILSELPADRVIAALDARDGEVVVEGWKKGTGRGILERIEELNGLVGGYLITFVEREGKLGGTAMEKVEELVKAAGPARVTIAGGVTTADEIAQLDRLNADAQVGMAIYTGRLDFGDAIAAPLVSDRPDGLFPTIVCDEHERALGLVYSDHESIRAAVDKRRGIYHSRKRGLWEKGASSGASQQLLRIDLDCDRDALRFIVKQDGAGFCHKNTWTCWGADRGLPALEKVLKGRLESAPKGSYTKRLFNDADLLGKKLREEAAELSEASSRGEVEWEAADVMYFTLVKMVRAGISLAEVENHLLARSRRVTRRPGNAKESSS